MLENEQISEKFQFLIDYGVPSSAIKKISKTIDSAMEDNYSVIQYIKEHSQYIYPLLLPYEKKLLKVAIDT